MSWVKRHLSSLPQDHLTIVYADKQTDGVGQYGRKWISFPHVGIYASFCLYVDCQFPFLANLGQLLAISCVEALDQQGVKCSIKWPNDLIIEGQKVGGVLVETMRVDEKQAVIIGLGMNVNTSYEQLILLMENFGTSATSLAVRSGKTWETVHVLRQCVTQWIGNLQILHETGFAVFAKKIESTLTLLHQHVLFSDRNRQFPAVCEGIDSLGRLKLRHHGQGIEYVYTGTLRSLA
jgi:BirA family biotin operon repressor/biotin-[acetyl-CoA-carboxylase] ligase